MTTVNGLNNLKNLRDELIKANLDDYVNNNGFVNNGNHELAVTPPSPKFSQFQRNMLFGGYEENFAGFSRQTSYELAVSPPNSPEDYLRNGFFSKKHLPNDYLCHLCFQKGHFIRDCVQVIILFNFYLHGMNKLKPKSNIMKRVKYSVIERQSERNNERFFLCLFFSDFYRNDCLYCSAERSYNLVIQICFFSFIYRFILIRSYKTIT